MKDLKMNDCGDNSCFFSRYDKKDRKGIRTNGGCRCTSHDIKREYHILHTENQALQREVDELRDFIKTLYLTNNDKRRVNKLLARK